MIVDCACFAPAFLYCESFLRVLDPDSHVQTLGWCTYTEEIGVEVIVRVVLQIQGALDSSLN
jgi:hypothetical protein